MLKTHRRMTAWLPATPCHPELRDRLIKVAKDQGKSVSALQREAIILFLERSDSTSDTSDRPIVFEEQEQAS